MEARQFHSLNDEGRRRGLRFRSAGRWAGTPSRTQAFVAVFQPSGPRPFDGRDLAVASACDENLGYLGDLWVSRMGGRVGFVNSWCLGVFVVSGWAGGSVPSRCSLCLGGFRVGGRKSEIRNPKSKMGRVSGSVVSTTAPQTQKASTRKQKPKISNPHASPASSKKPRAFISDGCDILFSFLLNLGLPRVGGW